MDYLASETHAAYLEWVGTLYDYHVITRADGTQDEHPYRSAAWRAFIAAKESERS